MKQTFLSFVLALLPIMASADAVEIGGIWYNLISKSTANLAEVTKKPSGYYSGAIVIKDKVMYGGIEYSVTKIGDNAFYYCTRLTSVTIPNSVTSIGNYAFYGCVDGYSGLTSVTIGNSVTSIGNWAFADCGHLTSITIPNSVTSIGDYAFSKCYTLTSVTIPNSVTSIGNHAFAYCSALTSVTIPNSVTNLESAIFNGCSSLTSVTIGNSITIIKVKTFYGCSSLISVTIPNSVTSIQWDAFNGCSSLTSVTIPNSVTSIEHDAFNSCSSLATITIGNGIKTIGENAFAQCTDLTDVYCMAEELSSTDHYGYGYGLYTNASAFEGSFVEAATLHVPISAINTYKATEPWSKFGTFVQLSGVEPGTQKCATPTISIKDGKIKFSCETEGAEFVSTVSSTDTMVYYDAELTLAYKYKVTVYATKAGYDNSDTATREIAFTENGKAILVGDVDGNGVVNVADHVELTKIIMNQ